MTEKKHPMKPEVEKFIKDNPGTKVVYVPRPEKCDKTKVVDAPNSDARTWLDVAADNIVKVVDKWLEKMNLPTNNEEGKELFRQAMHDIVEHSALPLRQKLIAIEIALRDLSMALGNPCLVTDKTLEVALIEFATKKLQDIKDGQ